jgi:AcrR family transcriptional regulator
MKEARFHHGNLRHALVEAGLRAVEARGSSEVSLRDLAREVGVSPTAAYRHFADKDALFAGVADLGFQGLVQASARATEVDPPDARLMALARAYVDYALAHPKLYDLMFAEPLDMARLAEVSPASAAAYAPLRAAVTAALPAQSSEEEIVDAIVRLWSVLHGYVTLRLANRLPRLATIDDRLAQVIGPVIATLQPRASATRVRMSSSGT